VKPDRFEKYRLTEEDRAAIAAQYAQYDKLFSRIMPVLEWLGAGSLLSAILSMIHF
jgi:hypothetical protein